jgi:hypothetical protein
LPAFTWRVIVVFCCLSIHGLSVTRGAVNEKSY